MLQFLLVVGYCLPMPDTLFRLFRRGYDQPVVTFYNEDMDGAIDEALEVIGTGSADIDAIANWCTFLTDEADDGNITEYQLIEDGHNLQPWGE